MRILLVKLSSLGDVVHTLPVVQDILAATPHAQIDWVVEKAFAPLLERVNGLHRIIPCELRRWRKTFWTEPTRKAWQMFKADLQMDAYDAVIDLQGLTKSAVVARLARLTASGKRYAMANRTDGSAYEAPTRWLADVAIALQPHLHAVARGRQLVASALQHALPENKDFGLKMPMAPNTRLQAAPKIIAFMHGTSRADKEWPLQHWVELGRLFMASGFEITLVHGSAKELATSRAVAAQINAAVWPLMPLDALAVELVQCAGVVGVDSGVSHVAVALDLPHVQIYNFDTAWRTGPVASGHQVSVFAQPCPSVQAVWQAWQQCQKHFESNLA